MNADFGQQNRPNRYTSNAPVGDQIKAMHRSSNQSWQDANETKSTIDKIMAILDVKTTLSAIIGMIRVKNGHTSSMPDNRGENTDHDERYVRKSKYDGKIAELEARITALEP